MKWKVGDKVRLVGRHWEPPGRKLARGNEVLIAEVTDRQVRFEGTLNFWFLARGFEIELVERKEENMIDISDVNVGDRVKLTRENGDEATFTVTGRQWNRLASRSNDHCVDSWDTMEIVERAFKPVPGLYTNLNLRHRAVLSTDGRMHYTSASGRWFEVFKEEHDTVLKQKDGWVREIEF